MITFDEVMIPEAVPHYLAQTVTRPNLVQNKLPNRKTMPKPLKRVGEWLNPGHNPNGVWVPFAGVLPQYTPDVYMTHNTTRNLPVDTFTGKDGKPRLLKPETLPPEWLNFYLVDYWV